MAGVPAGRGRAFHFQADWGQSGSLPAQLLRGPGRHGPQSLSGFRFLHCLCPHRFPHFVNFLRLVTIRAVFAFLSSWQGVCRKAWWLSRARRGEGSPQARAVRDGVIEGKERKIWNTHSRGAVHLFLMFFYPVESCRKPSLFTRFSPDSSRCNFALTGHQRQVSAGAKPRRLWGDKSYLRQQHQQLQSLNVSCALSNLRKAERNKGECLLVFFFPASPFFLFFILVHFPFCSFFDQVFP